jgi:potassium-transporting ATPase KdpC subunit
MLKSLKSAIIILAFFTVLTGFLYPLLITGAAQVIFPWQANGSILTTRDGTVKGSALIGQSFTDPKYFWGRLSATAAYPYNASSSGGSNFSVLNDALLKQVQTRIDALYAADPENTLAIPADLVTASGSGLDPDISIAAARYQAARVARVRNIPIDRVLSLIDQNTIGRTFGFLGESRVNVLKLNLALDASK